MKTNSAVNCFQFLVIKTLDSDPHWPEMLDLDLNRHWNQCGSTTLLFCSLCFESESGLETQAGIWGLEASSIAWPIDRWKVVFDPPNFFFILFPAVNFLSIFGHQNPGSGFDPDPERYSSLKCWIRIRIKWIRIRNTACNPLWFCLSGTVAICDENYVFCLWPGTCLKPYSLYVLCRYDCLINMIVCW